jgi:hypothetical protein
MWVVLGLLILILVIGCNRKAPAPNPTDSAPERRFFKLQPGPNVQEETQTALIKARLGGSRKSWSGRIGIRPFQRQ